MKVDLDKCVGCEACIDGSCPQDCIKMENSVAIINEEQCTNCGICKDVCPTEAIVE